MKGGNAVEREWWKCERGGMQGKGSGGSVKGGNAVKREWWKCEGGECRGKGVVEV